MAIKNPKPSTLHDKYEYQIDLIINLTKYTCKSDSDGLKKQSFYAKAIIIWLYLIQIHALITLEKKVIYCQKIHHLIETNTF